MCKEKSYKIRKKLKKWTKNSNLKKNNFAKDQRKKEKYCVNEDVMEVWHVPLSKVCNRQADIENLNSEIINRQVGKVSL